MKIVDEIISDLTNNNLSLEQALLKTKVLAYQLDNSNLLSWVTSELNGYNIKDIPDYRIVPCAVYGTITNGYYRYNHAQIPTLHIGLDKAKDLSIAKFNQSVTGLEHLMKDDDKSDVLISPLPPEYTSLVINQKFPIDDYFAETAQKEIPKSSVKQIISAIRSKLLDFMLELNKEVGNKAITENDKEKVNDIFTTTIIGDNNVIISGDNNIQKVSIKISKGNFKELKQQLENSGIKEEDIYELQTIIDDDNLDTTHKKFGNKVNDWMKKMFSKAVDGSWNIAIGAAGSLIADALSRYYGWK